MEVHKAILVIGIVIVGKVIMGIVVHLDTRTSSAL